MSIEGKIGEKELKRSTTVENSLQITPFYAKQSQYYAFIARKRRFHEKTNPIQTQLKPIQTQFKANKAKNKANSNPIKANKIALKIYPFSINCPIVYMIFGITL